MAHFCRVDGVKEQVIIPVFAKGRPDYRPIRERVIPTAVSQSVERRGSTTTCLLGHNHSCMMYGKFNK